MCVVKLLMNKIPTILCYIILSGLTLVSVGCANKSQSIAPMPPASVAKVEEVKETAIIIPKAESMLGVMYKYGGASPEGFDCSGFVQWVYNHAGVKLPRTAKAQSQVGEAVKSKDDLQVGDIVAFKRRRTYHTGIYLGDGKFIHSPRTNKDIRISDLSVSYFSKYYIGTRRVAELGPEEIAAAEKLLDSHESGKLVSKKSRNGKKS